MLSETGIAFLAAGYAVLAFFVVIERRLRKTDDARTLRGGAPDGGTTALVGSAFGIGIVLPLLMDSLSIGTYPITVLEGSVGLAAMLVGLGVRAWAARTLGANYTRTLLTSEGQRVIQGGPYKSIRHPGYLGGIILWSGFGVLSGNEIVAILLPVMFLAVYLRRISFEESMLVKELGEDYVEYRKRTKKLVPGIL
jgi:protein-S-isoprenylcysteine O-methyltransferase Ste14